MAWVYRQKMRRHGKIVTQGGKPVYLEKWYVRYRDHGGILRVQVGYADKASSVQLGARLEREAAQRKEGIYVADPAERSPTTLLPIYLMHLRGKGDTPLHVQSTKHRISEALKATKNRLDPGLVGNFLAKLRDDGKSIGTANGYLTALKGFCWWLVDFRAWPMNPLRKLRRNRSEAGRRRRRALSRAEFRRLIQATRQDTGEATGRSRQLSGTDRAMLYLVAAYTGLRASELASLTPESISGGLAAVEASHSKHRRHDEQPIPGALTKQLATWLKGRPAGQKLWPGRWYRRAASMLARDLGLGKIPVTTAAGVFDFHALRVQFITELARAGVGLVHAQRLARHSSPALTSNVYSRLTMGDLKAAVAKLPGVG